ncbi:IclR family transcriptional regulator [Lysinibacillus sp. Y5S-8]|uniref:IclR family transcriptional regulator domain-containing protein n=1 Tax=Lysinibacillus sp. Y5S-8 TaxID=3122488 RepID=UPI00114FC789
MISSVKKISRIIDLFLDGEPSLSNKEIADKLNLPPSSVHHFLKTMCQESILLQGSDKRYRLGWKILEWSNKVMYYQEINFEAGPIISNLVARFKGTSHIGMFDNGEVRFVYKAMSPHADIVPTFVGMTRYPAYSTSIGKVLLTYNPAFMLPMLEKGMFKQTANTITSVEDLKKELEVVYKNGYAISDQENASNTYGVAAPIKTYNGQVVAALNLVGEKSYMNGKDKQAIVREVIRSAELISRQLGYMTINY